MTEKCLTSTDHSRALCAKMYDLQTDGTLCDIQLRIGTNSLYLHSIVLAGCSDTLANELTRDSSDDTSCLSHLGVLDGDALQRLIRFLYTGEMLLNGDMDVSAISLCCQHMGLWAGVQLCEAYLKDRDEAATGVVVNYLTHGQNQTMSTDKPGVELLHCRPVTNVAQQNVSIVTDACKLKLHPCHSAETWLQMPANCKQTVPADSGANDQINGRKISETSCVPSVASTGQYKPYEFKFHGSNNTAYVGSHTRDVAEETHSGVDNECCHIDMSTAEKSMVSAAIDVRILCTHATSERGAIRNTNTLRQMEKHGNVTHITRRSSKKLASTSNGDEVVCRRSGRAKHVPKRYSENMAWGVTPGRIGTFGNQCEIDPSQKTPKKIKRGLERDCDIRCKEEHDVGLLDSLNHEPEEKSVCFNNKSQLKSQLQETLERKLTGGNRKTSSTSVEVRTIPFQPVQGRDAITGAEMVESNCDRNNRCESGEVVKPASNSQNGTVMYLRSNSTMQESCNQSLSVLGKLSSDDGNHIDYKCVKETAAAVMESKSFSHAVVIENSSCKIPLEVPPRESDKYKHSCKIPLEVPPRESDKYKHSCKIPLEVPPRESDKYKHKKCSICKETFATPDALVTHRKLCHQRARGPNPRNYSCDQCPYMARTEKLLLIHLNNKHDVSLAAQDKFPVHTCHVNGCGYKSLYKQYVWRHHEAQHTGRKFMCEYCGNELRSKVALTLHVRIHLGVKPHVCQICGQAFRQSSILKCHQRSVHETRTHHLLCHECPYTTSNKTSLDLHRYRRHAVALPSNISIYHCDICKFETVSKNTLQCHIRRHLGQRPFECKVCHKTFVSSDDLRGHAVWHLPVSERKYKCPYGVSEDCQYVAATNSKLNSHIRLQHTHKDDRPFTCHVCPYKSGVKGNLTKHLRSVHHIEVTTHQVRVMPYHRDRPAAAMAVTDPTNTTTAETQGRDTIFRQSDDSQTHTAVSSVLSITE